MTAVEQEARVFATVADIVQRTNHLVLILPMLSMLPESNLVANESEASTLLARLLKTIDRMEMLVVNASSASPRLLVGTRLLRRALTALSTCTDAYCRERRRRAAVEAIQ